MNAANVPCTLLRPLRELKHVVDSEQLDNVSCEVFAAGDGCALRIFDQRSLRGMMIVTAEMHTADEYFLAVQLTESFDATHPNAMAIKLKAADFCEENRVILDEAAVEGVQQYAFGLRFHDSNTLSESGRHLDKILNDLCDIFDSPNYDVFQDDVTDLLR